MMVDKDGQNRYGVVFIALHSAVYKKNEKLIPAGQLYISIMAKTLT